MSILHEQFEAGLNALRTSAGLFPLESTAFLRISGADRTRWLNGMATNNVAALASGEGSYNFFLSAQGKIQGDAYIFADGKSFLLQTTTAQRDTLQALLDRFIIMDDVELAPAFTGYIGLNLIGPKAPALLADLKLPIPAPLHLLHHGETTIIAAYAPTVPRYELWTTPEAATTLQMELKNSGAIEVVPQALEALRVLEGTPFFGIDIRDRDLPQETGQTRALHFSKGCYLGQEIVERIRSRGSVHRSFTTFSLSGEIPTVLATLETRFEDVSRPAGELTSIATLPGGTHLALGYVRREALDRNLPLLYPGGRATPIPVHSKLSESASKP